MSKIMKNFWSTHNDKDFMIGSRIMISTEIDSIQLGISYNYITKNILIYLPFLCISIGFWKGNK